MVVRQIRGDPRQRSRPSTIHASSPVDTGPKYQRQPRPEIRGTIHSHSNRHLLCSGHGLLQRIVNTATDRRPILPVDPTEQQRNHQLHSPPVRVARLTEESPIFLGVYTSPNRILWCAMKE